MTHAQSSIRTTTATAEFKDALNWNDKQVAALIGSLEAKGLGYGDDNEGNGHIFWLSDLGVDTIFDIIEAA